MKNITKRIISIGLMAALVLGTFSWTDPVSFSSYAVENTVEFNGGDGTPENPYKIGTPGQLFNMRQFPAACYVLENNIVFSESHFDSNPTNQPDGEDFYNDGKGWVALFASGAPFTGVVDGQGYTIFGILSKTTATWDQRTIFGYNAGTIKNLAAYNFAFTMDDAYGYAPGALIANNNKTGVVQNCNVAMDTTKQQKLVLSTNDANLVCINEGTVSNCFALMNVSISGGYSFGGLVITNYGRVENSYAAGKIENKSTKTSGVGGVACSNRSPGMIENCTNDVDITNAGFDIYQYVGGIAASNDCTIQYSKNNGNLIGYGLTGGITGSNDGQVYYSSNTGSIESQSYGKGVYNNEGYVGGVAGHNRGSILECFNNGKVRGYTKDSRILAYAGGLAGKNMGYIQDAYNAGEVSAEDAQYSKTAGGIVGYNQGGMGRCYNVGYVHCTTEAFAPYTDSWQVGGIYGYSQLTSLNSIKNCYYLVGSIWQHPSQWNDSDQTAAELMQQSSYFYYYAPFDFTNVWTMDGDPNYPYPELRKAPHRGSDKFMLQYIHALNDREDVFVGPAYLSPGDPLPEPGTPAASGYLFKGWFLDPEYLTPCDFETATMPYWHMSLYGKWEALSGTVTFNSDGGTKVEDKTVICGQPIGAVTPPTRTGYTFSGWVDVDGKTIDLDTKTMPEADYALTATWLPIEYTVNYNANGGTGAMAAFSMTYDVAKILEANTFKKDGYAFMGWSTSSTGSVAYKNVASVKNLTATNGETVTLYAKWAAPIASAASYNYNSVKISWAAACNATSYRIYRATSATGTYSLVKIADATARSYVNTGLVTGKTYYYKVSAVAGGKTYHHSTSRYAKAVPTTPTVALYKYSSTSIMVSWTGVSGANRYQIFRSTSATGTYAYIHTASSTESFWINTGLTLGKTYYYKVRAYHLEGTAKVYGDTSAVKYLKL